MGFKASGSTSVGDTIQSSEIDAKAVTYAKIQDVSATDKVLGRSTAGSGVVEEIACTAAGRALIDDANAAAQLSTLGIANVVIGAASGYKIARSASPVALDGSNPTTVASGLTTIVAAGVSLSGTSAPGAGTSTLSVAINGTNLDVYGWMPTGAALTDLIASTGTESFHWWAIGT